MTQIKPVYRHANLMLVLLLLAYMMSFIDRQILSLMVGPIRNDLEISDFQISLLQGAAFAIFYTTLGIPLGWAADRYRRTALVGIGAIVWSLATMACGLARSFGGLFGARIAVGAGEAALSPSAFSLLADAFPPERLARAIGIFVLALPLGAGLGFIAGGMVIELVASAEPTAWPWIGVLRPWQQVFMIVGLPGSVLGLVMFCLKEPDRASQIKEPGERDNALPLRTVLAYLWSRRRAYGPIFISMMFLSIAGYAMLSWYPTFLVRNHGLSMGQIGLILGVSYVIFGTLGTVGAPLFSEYLAARGHANSNLRTLALIGAGLIPFAAIGPLVSSVWLALLLAAPAVVLLNSGYGVASAELQIATPNRMRGMISALLILSNNLGGLALGSSLVPFLTDFLFHDDRKVSYSLAIVIGLSGLIAAWSASKGLAAKSGSHR